MPRTYSRHHIDKSIFLTAAGLPEGQGARNQRDNLQELTAEGMSGLNRQLYDYVAQALQMSLANIVASNSVEFQKLSQQVYSNIVNIVEGKMEDGSVAESMLENLDIYNGNATADDESPEPAPPPPILEPVEEAPVESREKEIVDRTRNVIDRSESTTKVTQERVVPTETRTKETAVEERHETHRIVERESAPDDSSGEDALSEATRVSDAAIEEANERASAIEELKTKLRLAFIYLRSQKLDIFKLLAAAQEDADAINDTQEEIDLDYEEELRYRRNLRREFNKKLQAESDWYEKTFTDLTEAETGRRISVAANPLVMQNVAKRLIGSVKSRSEKSLLTSNVTGKTVRTMKTVASTRRAFVMTQAETAVKASSRLDRNDVVVEDIRHGFNRTESRKTTESPMSAARRAAKSSRSRASRSVPMSVRTAASRVGGGRSRRTSRSRTSALRNPLDETLRGARRRSSANRRRRYAPRRSTAIRPNIRALEPVQVVLSRSLQRPRQRAELRAPRQPLFKTAVRAILPFKKPTMEVTYKVVHSKPVAMYVRLGLGRVRRILKSVFMIFPPRGAWAAVEVPADEVAGKRSFNILKEIKSRVEKTREAVKTKVKGALSRTTGFVSKLLPPRIQKHYEVIYVLGREQDLDELKNKAATRRAALLAKQQALTSGESTKKGTSARKRKDPLAKWLDGIKRKFTGKVRKSVKGVGKKIRKFAKKTKRAVNRGAKKFVNKAKKLGRRITRGSKVALGKLTKKANKALGKAKRRIVQTGKKLLKKAKKSLSKFGNKVKKSLVKVGKKTRNSLVKFGKRTKKTFVRFGKKIGKKLSRFTKRSVKKLWSKTKRFGRKTIRVARRLGKKAAKVASRFTKKTFRIAKRVGKKALKGVSKVGRRVFRGVAKTGARVARALYGAGKKAVKAAYRVASKVVTSGVALAGRGVAALGSAAMPIPYVGPVVGAILKGIGVGMNAASKFLRGAFKAIGKISAAVARAVEKAVSAASKAIARLKRRGVSKMRAKAASVSERINGFFKRLLSSVPGGGGAPSARFSFKTAFTNIGRSIRSFFAKMYYGRISRGIQNAYQGLRLRLRPPVLKLKLRYGGSAVKKAVESRLRGIYGQMTAFAGNLVNSGFTWVRTIMSKLAGSLGDVLSNLGHRISVLGTIGFKGFLASLLNWRVLLPIGIAMLFIFRKKVFPWIFEKGKWLFKNIGKIVSKVAKFTWGAAKWVFKWGKRIAGFLFKTGEKVSGVIPWLIRCVRGLLGVIYKVFPRGAGAPFLLGMALAGYVTPLLGAALFNALKQLSVWLVKDLIFGKIFSLILTVIPNPLRRWAIKWYGAFGLGTGGQKSEVVDLDAELDKLHEKTVTPINSMMAHGVGDVVNPKLKAMGLPGLTKIVSMIKKNTKPNNEAICSYAEFIKASAPHLTDLNHVAQFTEKFYTSEAISRALLSVFFFTDPMTGRIISTIPRSAIPATIRKIQKMVLDARDNPKKLARVNRDVLTYFDYMNVGRSKAIQHILNDVQQKMKKMSESDPDKVQQLATEFATDFKTNAFARRAIQDFHHDVVNKTSDMKVRKGDAIGAKSGSVEGGSALDRGVQDLLKTTGAPSAKEWRLEEKAAKREGRAPHEMSASYFNKNFTWNVPALVKQPSGKFTGPSAAASAESKALSSVKEAYERGKAKREKYQAWKLYQYNAGVMQARGATEGQMKAAGYGKTYDEWSRQYDMMHAGKTPAKPQQKKPPKPDVPKLVLPTISFPTAKAVSVNLPGLTRDVKEGTDAFKLYQMGVAPKGGTKSNALTRIEEAFKRGRANQEKYQAWKLYQYNAGVMKARGASAEQLAAAGYGKSYDEWSKQYDMMHGGVKPKEGEGKPATEREEARADAVEASKEKAPSAKSPVERMPNIPGMPKIPKAYTAANLDKLMTMKQLRIDTEIKGINLNSLIKPRTDVRERRKKEFEERFTHGKISEADNAKEVKALQSPTLQSVSDLDFRVSGGVERLSGLNLAPPKGTELVPKFDTKIYGEQGINITDDAQWVSVQEAHRLEQELINNAKDVRGIIKGIRKMGDNLELAKADLTHRLQRIKENPVGQVVQAPAISVPAGVAFEIPDFPADYDPLPPLV